jgi:hypothetical protein
MTKRRRTGQNCVNIEPDPTEPRLPLGDAILKRFSVRDQPLSDEQILRGTFQIAQGVQLHNALEFRDQQWIRPPQVHMVQTLGLQLAHDLTKDVAEFVAKLDGSAPLSELVASLAGQASAPPQKVEAECIALVKTLLDRGFVRQVS